MSSNSVADASTLFSSSSGSSVSFSVATTVKHVHHYITLKLKPGNYLYWHTLIHPFLSSQSLLGFVDGTSTCPPSHILSADLSSSISNPDFALWKQNDDHVKTIILSSLSKECFPVIVGKETSADIWSALATAYANPSNSKALQLHEELLECRRMDSSISSYLGKIKTLADNLVTAGRPLSHEDFLTYILWGLRPEFQHVSTTLHARKEKMSFEDLQSLLLTQEYIYLGHKASSVNRLALFSSAIRDFP